jgi:probable DNA metabolism protein
MNLYRYDHTFEGLLTLAFESYARKCFPHKILAEGEALPLFYESYFEVITDEKKARRVWDGLHKKLSKEACGMLSIVFLSEMDGVEMLLFRYIQKALAAASSIEVNFADPDVLECSKIYRKVRREAERMLMFVRFQKTADGVFFAPIEPKYNVLSLVADFFTDRFGDQKWIIYDLKRRYGLYYDLRKTEEISFDSLDFDENTGKLRDEQAAADEQLFQQLWKTYFKSITIEARKNLKLQQQHLPKRFWKYLPEKQ